MNNSLPLWEGICYGILMQNFKKFGGIVIIGLLALSTACSSKDKNYDQGSAYPSGNQVTSAASAVPAAQAAAAMPAEPLPALTPEEIGPTINYTVKTGDSLWLIAKHHKSSIGRLKRINQLNSDNILAGQVLKVPSNAPKAAASPAVPAASTPAKAAPKLGGFRRPSASASPPSAAAPQTSGSGGLKIQD